MINVVLNALKTNRGDLVDWCGDNMLYRSTTLFSVIRLRISLYDLAIAFVESFMR